MYVPRFASQERLTCGINCSIEFCFEFCFGIASTMTSEEMSQLYLVSGDNQLPSQYHSQVRS